METSLDATLIQARREYTTEPLDPIPNSRTPEMAFDLNPFSQKFLNLFEIVLRICIYVSSQKSFREIFLTLKPKKKANYFP